MGKVMTKQPNFPLIRPFFEDHERTSLLFNLKEFDAKLCDCFAYGIQPLCTDNRHFHAVLDKDGYLVLRDLGYKKEWKLKLTLHQKYLLPKKVLRNTGLEHFIVVGFSRGVIVIQAFYQKAVRFFVYDLISDALLATYDKKYQGQEKLQLYECYLSPDHAYMALKTNYIYLSVCCARYRQCDFLLLKMCVEDRTCREISMEVDLVYDNTAVTFDPRIPCKYLIIAAMDVSGPQLSRYCLTSRSFTHALSVAIEPGNKFLSVQCVKDRDLVLLSVLGDSLSGMPMICNNYNVTNYMYNLELMFKGQFSYISPFGVRHFPPVFSPSGKYLSCAQQVLSLASNTSLKSLRELCRCLIMEVVLSEDLPKLPLPKCLIQYIQVETIY